MRVAVVSQLVARMETKRNYTLMSRFSGINLVEVSTILEYQVYGIDCGRLSVYAKKKLVPLANVTDASENVFEVLIHFQSVFEAD